MKTRSKEGLQLTVTTSDLMEEDPLSAFPEQSPEPDLLPALTKIHIEGHLRKPKKHKHKKHKRKRDSISPSKSKRENKTSTPHLKLKIKLGGETFATKSVSRSSVTDAVLTEQEALQDDTAGMEEDDAFEDVLAMLHSSHENDEEAVSISETVIIEEDDEEAWLEALEAGELNEHGELKREKDVNLLTARQKALLQVKADPQQPPWELPTQPSELTEEMIRKRAVRAQRRRDQAQKKDLENKKQTIERLLKKQEVKTKAYKSGKYKIIPEATPQIHYVNSLTGISLSLPEGMEFPLSKAIAITPPKPVSCGVEGCTNIKKYACSQTGVPLCSLECYKKNLRKDVIVAS